MDIFLWPSSDILEIYCGPRVANNIYIYNSSHYLEVNGLK